MVSKWRQNIPDLGLAYGDVELIARYLAPIPACGGFLVRRRGYPTLWCYYQDDSQGFPVPGIALSTPAIDFPGPFNVEPDH